MQIYWDNYFENVHQQNTVFISFHLLFISCKYVLEILSCDILKFCLKFLIKIVKLHLWIGEYCFSICYFNLPNYIQRNKLYHGTWNLFTVLGRKSNNFCWHTARKDFTCIHLQDTMLESQERLDKTMYSKSSIEVCHSHQQWVVFWICHNIRTKYTTETWQSMLCKNFTNTKITLTVGWSEARRNILEKNSEVNSEESEKHLLQLLWIK